MKKIELHKEYFFEDIEAFAEANNLLEKVDGYLQPLSDGDIGEIGEMTQPLYFEEDESIAANFILTGIRANQSYWRCIYLSYRLSDSKKEEV